MSTKTGIEWTDATWNPIRGCSRVSEGCRNCYAEAVANRFCGPGSPYEGVVQIDAMGKGLGKWNGEIKFVEKRLLDPLRWKKPQRIFVNSMSDLFHPNVTDEMIDKMFAVMALCPQHTFQVLTKRPERMLAWFTDHYRQFSPGARELVHTYVKHIPGYDGEHPKWMRRAIHAMDVWPLPNVQLGVSVENQPTADARIPLLLQTPASVRFISAEPFLGSIDLESSLGGTRWIGGQRGCAGEHHGRGTPECPRTLHHHHDDRCAPGLDWVIVGGESGPGARPMHPDWARSLRDQCVAAWVPFFFKQWGEWIDGLSASQCVFRDGGTGMPMDAEYATVGYEPGLGFMSCADDHIAEEAYGFLMYRVGKKAAGRLLDGREWNEMPEVAR
jgi:protein gp37